MTLDNEAPQIFEKSGSRPLTSVDFDDSVEDPIDSREIFDLVKDIKDPEHPLTLEDLNVVREDQISYDPQTGVVVVEFTPTIDRCSMAPLIGLSIFVKLLRTLSENIKLIVRIAPGSHESEEAYNKQLNDKERVAAALENSKLLSVINACIVNENI